MKSIRKNATPCTSKSKLFKKVMSVICALALAFTMTPAASFADENNNAEQPKEEGNSGFSQLLTLGNNLATLLDYLQAGVTFDKASKPFIIGEDVGARESTVKSYRLSDGSTLSCVFPLEIHFLNNNGAFVDFDNTLVETARGIEPTSSSFDFVLPRDLTNGKGVLINAGKSKISWRYDIVPVREQSDDPDADNANDPDKPDDANNTDKTPALPAITPKRIEKENLKLEGDERFTTLTKLTDALIYEDIVEGVSLEYIATPKTGGTVTFFVCEHLWLPFIQSAAEH